MKPTLKDNGVGTLKKKTASTSYGNTFGQNNSSLFKDFKNTKSPISQLLYKNISNHFQDYQPPKPQEASKLNGQDNKPTINNYTKQQQMPLLSSQIANQPSLVSQNISPHTAHQSPNSTLGMSTANGQFSYSAINSRKQSQNVDASLLPGQSGNLQGITKNVQKNSLHQPSQAKPQSSLDKRPNSPKDPVQQFGMTIQQNSQVKPLSNNRNNSIQFPQQQQINQNDKYTLPLNFGQMNSLTPTSSPRNSNSYKNLSQQPQNGQIISNLGDSHIGSQTSGILNQVLNYLQQQAQPDSGSLEQKSQQLSFINYLMMQNRNLKEESQNPSRQQKIQQPTSSTQSKSPLNSRSNSITANLQKAKIPSNGTLKGAQNASSLYQPITNQPNPIPQNPNQSNLPKQGHQYHQSSGLPSTSPQGQNSLRADVPQQMNFMNPINNFVLPNNQSAINNNLNSNGNQFISLNNNIFAYGNSNQIVNFNGNNNFMINHNQKDEQKQGESKDEGSCESRQRAYNNENKSLKNQHDSQILAKEEFCINKSHFLLQFVVGKGGFGKVWKVEQRKTHQTFAMKEMSKALVITKKSVNSVINERNLLCTLKHPFIVNMIYAFQDRDNLYLVMDFMSGGDLRYHIGIQRRFNEEQTRFFVACIFMGLEYLHKNDIIHRDIKPENLVLDDDGYVHVTDMGIARHWKPDNENDTSGTPGYMAPEVMCRQPHTFAVDYFALGVIAFEFMLGRRPYLGRSRQEIRNQILAKRVQIKKNEIPEGWSLEAADFINRLIERKPAQRLGINGSDEVKNHPWLRNFPWKKLYSKELKAPFMPQKEDNFDFKQQITVDDEQTNEIIQQNAMLLRKPQVQELFGDYNFDNSLFNPNVIVSSENSASSVSRSTSTSVSTKNFLSSNITAYPPNLGYQGMQSNNEDLSNKMSSKILQQSQQQQQTNIQPKSQGITSKQFHFQN